MKFIQAIYNKDFYNDVVNNQKLSKAIWYWIRISLLVVISLFIYIGIFLTNELPIWIDESIPNFTIQEGQLEIEKPIYLGVDAPTEDVAELDVDYEGVPIVIDPNFEYRAEEFKLFQGYFVATKDTVYIKGTEGTNEISYSEYEWLENTNRDQLFQKLKSEIPLLNQIIIPLIIVSIVTFLTVSIFYLSGSFFGMLILTLIGLIFSAVFKKGLKFKDVLKVTLYSRTLPLILSCILIISMGKFTSHLLTILHIVLIGYFIHKIKPKEVMTESVPTAQPTQPVQPAQTAQPLQSTQQQSQAGEEISIE